VSARGIVAAWDRREGCYSLRAGQSVGEVFSLDGDLWLRGDGTAPIGPEWDAIEIHMDGGPRDGESVG
jgi:hypothetical protein